MIRQEEMSTMNFLKCSSFCKLLKPVDLFPHLSIEYLGRCVSFFPKIFNIKYFS